jgi:dipeptidase E
MEPSPHFPLFQVFPTSSTPLIDKHIIAFGGDGFYTEPENKLTANFLVDLARRHPPKVCFLPTASGDAESYVQAFYARYTTDLCEPSHLYLFRREVKDLREFLLSKDVIYVGGGNTANMLAIWRVHGVDTILREAYEAGIVLCGTSAGALCWFECGVTDSFGLDLAPLYDGLGFIGGSACPHYDSEERRQPQYHKFVRDGFPAGYAIDEGAGGHFVNGEFREGVSSKSNARVLLLRKEKKSLIEIPLPVRYLGGK